VKDLSRPADGELEDRNVESVGGSPKGASLTFDQRKPQRSMGKGKGKSTIAQYTKENLILFKQSGCEKGNLHCL